MKKVFVTTSNNIENGKIVEYHGVVSSHIVAGTGFLSDFVASFSDFFGGRSKSYRRQLESLYDEALEELSNKAQTLGANGIISLRIELDNISAKGMSMFMITAVGTATTIKFNEEKQSETTNGSITSSTLVNELQKKRLLEKINDDNTFLSTELLESILSVADNDIIIPLSRRYFYVLSNPANFPFDYTEKFNNVFAQIVQMVDREYAIQGVYEGLKSEKGCSQAKHLIRDCSLFDAKQIIKLINEGDVTLAIDILGYEQPAYNEVDLHDMEDLLAAFDNLPDVGKVEFVPAGMFNKEGTKYVCAHEHMNDPDVEFCSKCGENIKGLKKESVKAIEEYRQRVQVLRELLSK